MFSIDLNCGQAEKDILIADLFEAGCTGVIELSDTAETAGLRAFFQDAAESEILARFGGTPTPADNRDWVAFAREHLQPMLIGERIFVCPEWRDDSTPPGRIRIEVNAGLAFGTGAHETTRLCLESIERNLLPGMSFADVGTGSGILAEAASKLGAGSVTACDNDADAVDVALENFQRAGLNIQATVGSAGDLPAATFDLVAANISPAWVADLASDWARILKPGGRAILSGFEAADIPLIAVALTSAGMKIAGEFGDRDWRMIEVLRTSHNK